MKLLPLTGTLHVFRMPISEAMAALRKQPSKDPDLLSRLACADGDILMCHHFPRDADKVHLVQMHDFYKPNRVNRVPSVAASFLREESIPFGRWKLFVIDRNTPHLLDLRKVLPRQVSAFEFKSGHDEMRIASFLKKFILICKGKKLRFDTFRKTFVPAA
ncbi:hypothetical protein XU18_4112 [Perkinsela sp. CCAP 1560/4]|nr:hypothetical protein XU18_4112 [Perkinsela sp. CCAP 1560/4]|eukprot:KNH04700.1 hypothetical protein XU18_4112 [Perkinsela sp. CCAP 1560/4]